MLPVAGPVPLSEPRLSLLLSLCRRSGCRLAENEYARPKEQQQVLVLALLAP